MKFFGCFTFIVSLWTCFCFRGYDCSLFFSEKSNVISEIRSKLLNGYNPAIRPVKDHRSNTTVTFAISLNAMDLDDHTQMMTAVTFLRVMWNDEFLKWNPLEFEGLKTLHFDKDEIWMPDIALFNSANSYDSTPRSSLPVVCSSDGLVIWVPPFTATVPCQIDIADWPSDMHACNLRFGSWAHDGEEISLKLENNSISLEAYEINKRWSVINYTSKSLKYTVEDMTYDYVDFNFTVKREAASHALFVTQTTFAVTLMILGSYLLPICYHLSRFLIHLFSITILITCNFALFFSLPATGGSIPHVVKFFSGAIVLTSLSLLCNVIMATTLTVAFDVKRDLRERLVSVCKSEGSALEIENTEIAYSSLDDDSLDISNGAVRDEAEKRQQEKLKQSANTRKVIRVLNIVLFFMFSLAYIVDYTIMRKAIAY